MAMNNETILRDNEVAFLLADGTQVIMNLSAYLTLKAKGQLPTSVPASVPQVSATTIRVAVQTPAPAPAAPKVPASVHRPYAKHLYGVYAIELAEAQEKAMGLENLRLAPNANAVLNGLTPDNFRLQLRWYPSQANAAYQTDVDPRYVSRSVCSWNRKLNSNNNFYDDKFAVSADNYGRSKMYVFVKAEDVDKLYRKVAKIDPKTQLV